MAGESRSAEAQEREYGQETQNFDIGVASCVVFEEGYPD